MRFQKGNAVFKGVEFHGKNSKHLFFLLHILSYFVFIRPRKSKLNFTSKVPRAAMESSRQGNPIRDDDLMI
jgi:hypothetical protein